MTTLATVLAELMQVADAIGYSDACGDLNMTQRALNEAIWSLKRVVGWQNEIVMQPLHRVAAPDLLSMLRTQRTALEDIIAGLDYRAVLDGPGPALHELNRAIAFFVIDRPRTVSMGRSPVLYFSGRGE